MKIRVLRPLRNLWCEQKKDYCEEREEEKENFLFIFDLLLISAFSSSSSLTFLLSLA